MRDWNGGHAAGRVRVRRLCPPYGSTAARSTALFHMRRWRPCRRRRATARRTITGAAAAARVFAPAASMVAALRLDLAAKHVIGPRSIAENHRYQDGDTEQHEDLTVLGGCRLPDGDALRHDVRVHADTEPGIGQ